MFSDSDYSTCVLLCREILNTLCNKKTPNNKKQTNKQTKNLNALVIYLDLVILN